VVGEVAITITAACSDGQGGTDTAYHDIATRVWYVFDLDGYTPDSTPLANPGTSEAVFTFEADGPFPPGAIAESVLVTTDFVPEDSLRLEIFNVWVVSPSGTEELIYDGFNLLHLLVDDLGLYSFVGEPADGTWKLRVTRENSGVEGYADQCGLTVFYRW